MKPLTIGGGLYVAQASGSTVDEVIISSALISNNITTDSSTNEGGAGIYVNQMGQLSLNGVALTGNDSSNIGGGMYVRSIEQLDIIDSVVEANQGSLGAGVYLSGGQLRVENSQFNNNDASSSGGGLYLSSVDALITGSTFDGNNANRGGGIHSRFGSTMLLNSHVLNNQVTREGGGIHLYRTDLTMAAAHGTGSFLCDAESLGFNQYCSTLSGNLASEEGGGIYAVSEPGGNNTLLKLADAEVTGNEAILGGSVMYVDFPNAARVEVHNALFHHNGSGVNQETMLELHVIEAVSLLANTMAQNQGSPFMLDTPGLQAEVKNNIIHNNDMGPYISFSVVLDEGCNLSQTPEAGSQSTGANLGDPLFTSSARGPYRLAASSPAVNACASGPDDDLDGQLRPGNNAMYDLGAFEMDGAGSAELIFTSGFQW